MKHFWVLILAVGLTGCGTSEGTLQTASAETEVARPTATFTSEPTATAIPTQTPLPSATEDTCNQDELSAWSVPVHLALFNISELFEEAADIPGEELVSNASRFQEMTNDTHELYDILAETPPTCAEEAERLLQVYLIQVENGWEAAISDDWDAASVYFQAAKNAQIELNAELTELGF